MIRGRESVPDSNSPGEASIVPGLARFRPGAIGSLQLFQLLRYGGMLLSGVLLAKSPLDLDVLGWFEALMLLSGFSGFFWTGALMNALVPLYVKTNNSESTGSTAEVILETERRALLSTAFRWLMGINTLLVLFLLLTPSLWIPLLGIPWDGSVHRPEGMLSDWHLFCAFIFFNNPAYLVEYHYFLKKAHTGLIRYGIAVFLLQVLAVGLPPLLGFGLQTSLWGLLGSAFLRWCWMLYQLGWSVLFQAPGQVQQTYIRMATPLAGSLLLGGAAAYLDGFIVGNKLGADALAIFRYGARELPLVYLLANAFSTAASAAVAEDLSSGTQLIRQRADRLLRNLTPITLLFLLSSAWLFPRVFRPEFADAHLVFNIYLLLLLPRLVFPQTILTGIGETGILFRISLLELSVNVGLSLWWVGLWGMAGVAWATVVAHVLDKLLLIIYLWYKKRIPPSTYIQGKRYAAYSVILAACYLLAQ